MPLGAVVTGAALSLTGSMPALAADGSTGGSADAAATGSLKQATFTATDTASSRITRKATAKATKRLTKKIKATAKVTAWSTRTVKAKRTVTVTTSAADYETALAEARTEARQKAHQKATAAAIATAKKQANSHAAAKAKHRAQVKAANQAEASFGAQVVADAADLKGTPYVYGATGPSAFDCSGYVGYVLRESGVTHLNRTSSGLVSNTTKVSKRAKKRGDLVFFNDGSGVYHVGIYAGGGKIWHAPGTGRSVTKATIWTSNYSVGRVKV